MEKMISGGLWVPAEDLPPRGQAPRPQEDGVDHRGREDAGEGVLLRGVVAAEEGHGARRRLGSMRKLGLGTEPQDTQRGVPGEGAETDHYPRLEQPKLTDGVGEAGVAFFWGRLVLRRGAADGGGDPGSAEAEAVFAVARDGSVREAGAVERGEEEVARAVAGEKAARPVRAVGSGGEAQDHQLGVRVAEAGDGTPPVGLARVGGPLISGDLLAPLDEPRATPARDDRALKGVEPSLFSCLPDLSQAP